MKLVPFWPTLATVGNLICGFSSMAEAFEGNYERAAWLILVAMLFDAADGRLARLTRTTSEFGAQLDSLADIISFGAAPAFLIHFFVLKQLPNYSGRFVWTASGAYAKFTWTATGIYLTCTALRLARFNVETTADADSHKAFSGLPSPGAAALMVTVVIFLKSELGGFLFPACVWVLPFLSITCAVLMVTKLRYPHVVNQLDFGGRPFHFLVLVIFVIMLIAFAHEIGLFLVAGVYVASGPVGLAIDQVIERLASADGEDTLF